MKRFVLPPMAGLFFVLVPFLSPFAEAADSRSEILSRIPQSHALELYRNRPVNELSKLIYLIDRFSEANATILYDGHQYRAALIAPLARLYLMRNYRGESARDWVRKRCYRSWKSGELIWGRVLYGQNFRPAHDILFEELDALDLLSEDLAAAQTTPEEIKSLQISGAGDAAGSSGVSAKIPAILPVPAKN